MSRTWHLSDVELIVLWDKLFGDRLPSPLFALHRGANAEEWARSATAAWSGVRNDGELHDALGRIARAEVRVAVQAVDPRAPDRGDGPIRILGGRQGAVATLIRQLPGETIWHSGGYVVSTGGAERLAGAVVGALPARDPGRLSDTQLVIASESDAAEYDYGRSPALAGYLEIERRSAAWLELPAERLGEIETCLGSSIFGPRGIVAHRIAWRDLVDDGRYAVGEGTAPIATAVDRARLAAMITADITKVLQTLEDERCA
ncbi:ESX secretion-associated protein EspG [Nocardia sp. NBC_01503]|uniref:ESX secretion-associated protein EspG n=1 Tax=Nocardia sp. NBC_01503 TaxID=2975997 RepID=UPI002E7B11ED|nr:ESX secretion-associated protein EspG [Nocardia sp. NBC_01503]WTL29550.1 ESX secretion-associated protein EspG [Nocardia sp. NBC_01503]